MVLLWAKKFEVRPFVGPVRRAGFWKPLPHHLFGF